MIIVDTGAWVALADRKDRHHSVCRKFFSQNREELVVTYPISTEAMHLLFSRVGVRLTLAWLDAVRESGLTIFPLDASHLERISAPMHRYADFPMDLADASLVILAEHLGHGRIVSTDRRDVGAYRWKSRHPFHNLLDDLEE